MWGVILLIGMIYPWNITGPFDARLVHLILCVAGGTVAFFGAALLLKSPEITTAIGLIRRRLAKRSNTPG